MLLHVGYELEMTEQIKKLLLQACGADDKMCALMLAKPIVAVLYNPHTRGWSREQEQKNQDMQKTMREWLAKQKKDDIFYAKGIFVDLKSRYLVVHGTIGPTHHWVTLIKGTDISPIHLKTKVASGDLGKEITIDRLAITCKPYSYTVK
jgi:hypothetical protein